METKGNVVIEDIKIGDIHFEFQFGMCIKSKVIEAPVFNDGYWSWKNECCFSGKKIDYGVRIGHSHYGPNVYDYEAYMGCKFRGKE